jgi:uncharacterized protein (TIGR02246 family)
LWETAEIVGENMRSRELLVGALFLTVLAGVRAAGTQASAADEKAIGSIVPNFEKAWTKCDAKALATLWTEDGDFQSPYNSFAKGRKEIESFYHDAFASGYCGSKATGKIENIRMVQKKVAIVDGAWSIQGARSQSGHEAPEEKGRFTAIAIKQNGAWLMVAQREMIPAIPK